jgi:radical SAM protein with 4Fe4S-binding SPASM domain
MSRHLSFEITSKCNLKCTYCCVPPTEFPPDLTTKEIISMLKEAKKLGIKSFSISGGEALIYKDLKEVVEVIKDCKIQLLTNGMLLGNEEILKEVAPNIQEFVVSLDEPPNVEESKYRKGSNPKVIFNNIKKVKERFPNIKLSITTLLNNYNIYKLNEIYDYIKDIGIYRWRLNYLFYRGRVVTSKNFIAPPFEIMAKEVRKIILRHLKEKPGFQLYALYLYDPPERETLVEEEFKDSDHPCGFCRASYINSKGDIILCPHYFEPLTNIKENKGLINSYEICKKDPSIRKKHKILSLKVKDIEGCKDCRYLKMCGCGCRGNALIFLGDITFPDPLVCSMRVVWEKYILDILPKEMKKKFKKLINPNGKVPQTFKNVESILNLKKSN